ncbi:hypothetical protein AJ80_03929 [Polytolypa hystricis UAMH7299]|uniref:ADF-H domain-containing protein n=1 Tax=Polytolypa hystricis (strain UAMH7299) TaxID=1447883 RepID=A0A2B7YEC7_POLH7|nr:hypothetical protein AJ80_03929 [Polytolypa hystricis UAMH7299]
MSLNGLDDPAVVEAYQTALTEAGGWFLLKYVARDVVDLLGRGTGGVAEIRITIDGYEEKSPLYGFLQYRRRKVILRYVPEGISRLLQARITVQFQSILDKFSPHDTVFSLAVSSELTESALSSACLLHAASSSMTSSTSSLRRRRLGEITEDAEETSSPTDDEVRLQAESYRDARSESIFSGISEATAVPGPQNRETDSRARTDSISRPSQDGPDIQIDKALPTVPYDRPDSRATQKHYLDLMAQPIGEPRKSTQSMRPSLRDLDTSSLYRPKVKLGPRPSMDVNGRPRTAGSMGRSQENRPVASLPAGVRSSSRRTVQPRPKSQADLPVPPLPTSLIPPVPSLLIPPPPLNLGGTGRNAPPSPRSIKSMPASSLITPEKQRLMRALQLRKQRMEEKKKKDATDEVPITTKLVHAEENKENIEIATVELAPTSEDVSDHKATQSSSSPDGASEAPSTEQQHLPCPAANKEDDDEKRKEPSLPDPSKPDSAVDVGTADSVSTQDAPSTPSTTSETSAENFKDLSTPTSPSIAPVAPAENDKTPPESSDEPSTALDSETAPAVSEETSNHTEGDTVSPSGAATPSVISSQETVTPRAEPVDAPKESSSSVTSESVPAAEEAPPGHPSEETPPPKADDPRPISQPTTGDEQPATEPTPNNDVKQVSDKETDDVKAEAPQHNEKRKGVVGASQIMANPDDSDEEDNLLSDDSFMEELKSATLQEAKPIAVPKSPYSSSGEFSPAEPWRTSRVTSSPTIAGQAGPDVQALPVGRSASGSYLETQTAVPVLVAKKVNVSSGISKRIKALEMFSSREPGPSLAPPHVPVPTGPSTTSPFEKFRKRASMSQTSFPLSPSTKPNAQSSSPPSPDINVTGLPKRSDSLLNQNQHKSKSNSVSVTARIVRDPAAPANEPPSDPSEPSILNLQRSPLIVEQDSAEGTSRRSSSIPPIPEQRSMSTSSAGSRRGSNTPAVFRSDSMASRVSSRSKYDGSVSRSSSDINSGVLDSVDEGKEDKKESRKSRIIRRMSSITTNSRRGIISALSPSLKEEDPPEPPPKEDEPTREPPQVVDIGEVNVQFPDTLLWKRRFMRVDDQGYLILTPGTIDGTSRNMIKRYHMSEFRTPCLPDQDRQELPNSIVLDFQNGSTLQCACESRQGQNAVLQVLVEAHGAYHKYIQAQ